ncbi:octicosapeptide/Phox/Bem1p family protein [Striga asiatica]|uniref:Octicosapeptide/Phox/Bem1p family protein n=1 Tax=Striga asiatica TaxID=4170 RepID=A0A5A7PM43_STRAF|nr:octicosapeptide/Phox/Bem1p family protein [Striga asiatica]
MHSNSRYGQEAKEFTVMPLKTIDFLPHLHPRELLLHKGTEDGSLVDVICFSTQLKKEAIANLLLELGPSLQLEAARNVLQARHPIHETDARTSWVGCPSQKANIGGRGRSRRKDWKAKPTFAAVAQSPRSCRHCASRTSTATPPSSAASLPEMVSSEPPPLNSPPLSSSSTAKFCRRPAAAAIIQPLKIAACPVGHLRQYPRRASPAETPPCSAIVSGVVGGSFVTGVLCVRRRKNLETRDSDSSDENLADTELSRLCGTSDWRPLTKARNWQRFSVKWQSGGCRGGISQES